MKRFNTAGPCIPTRHYMVDISERVRQIRKMVDNGDYFCMNRGRQYGKTTTIAALERELCEDYLVISLDFQQLGSEEFVDENTFANAFVTVLQLELSMSPQVTPDILATLDQMLESAESDRYRLLRLFVDLGRIISSSQRPIVLIIDEVDSASNNQVFLDFLAQLRLQYLRRAKNLRVPAFQSVILAGVTDIRHLRSKIRDEDQHKVNSPWNIAVEFAVDMDLSVDGIQGMLADYESDHATEMDVAAVAQAIREYTHGYPFLVSRICQIMDQKLVGNGFVNLSEAWTVRGVDEAVRIILSETNTLFDSLMGKLQNYLELRIQLRALLMRGESIACVPDDVEQQQLLMYGFVRVEHNKLVVANRVFEMRLYVFFVGESERNSSLKRDADLSRGAFVTADGGLDVPKIMDHFIRAHNRIHGQSSPRFLEEEARERFLTYISPIINGTGTYSVEEQTRDQRRMDVVIHWLGRRYVVELKVWRGERYHEEGEQQIVGYLDYFSLSTGYLLSFDFRNRKVPGVRRVHVGERVLFEGTV